MKKKIMWAVVSGLMVLSLVMASCGPKEEEVVKEEPVKEAPVKEEPAKEEPVQKEEVKAPVGEVPWWERKYGEPKYGGTMTLRLGGDITIWDMWWSFLTPVQGVEGLFIYDYTIPEEEYDIYKCLAAMDSPTTMGTKSLPHLALSAEKTDPVTWVVHLRKGVYWHNKPPVNGREFTAYDVEYHWNRLLGLGKYGFTTKSPLAMLTAFLNIASVEAMDKYTVVYKFKSEALTNRDAIVAMGNSVHHYTAPKEVIDKWGDGQDWTRSVSTGAFMITDYVAGSLATYKKNPNYYLNDYRYPENKLPYIDVLRQLIIPDASTAVAALRAGKIDILAPIGWEQAKTLKTSNPEFQQYYIFDSGGALNMRVDRKPWTDIRVRKAMQMAMDLKTLATSFWGGYPTGEPMGVQGPYAKGFTVPYAEWPQELKDEFAYNPEKAKALLKDAGYPNGFKCTCTVSTAANLDLLQIVKSWLFAIGVDMAIQTMDPTSASAYLREAKDEMNFTGTTGVNWPWQHSFARDYTPNPSNNCNNNDQDFNKLFDSAGKAATGEDLRRISREMDLYDLTHHWRVYLQPQPNFYVYQPWFKGISGENLHTDFLNRFVPHWWIDTDMKKSMGY